MNRFIVKTILKQAKEDSDIRRFSLEAKEGSGYITTLATTADSYLVPKDAIVLSYVDDEGDACTIGGEEEFKEALRIATVRANGATPTLKLLVVIRPGFEPSTPRPVTETPKGAPEVAPGFSLIADVSLEAKAPTTTPAPKAAVPDRPAYSVKFIRDVTLPDGSAAEAGSTVTKKWAIENDGAETWPDGMYLSFIKGDILPLPAPGSTTIFPYMLPIAPQAPGEGCEIPVELIVPAHLRTGTYRAEFEIHLPSSGLETKDSTATGTRVSGDYRLFAELKVKGRTSALFVEDVELPDGTIVLPNATIEKIWRIRNDGPDAWPTDAYLKPTSAAVAPQALSASPFNSNKEDGEDGVRYRLLDAPVAPGAAKDVRMLLTAPSKPGRHRAEFELMTPSGRFSGDYKLWADVHVQAPELSRDEILAQLPQWLKDQEVFAAASTLVGEDQGPSVHYGVICDGCGMDPIKGIRFKCMHPSCPDFDLCEACEAAGKHPADHNLLKTRSPRQLRPNHHGRHFGPFGGRGCFWRGQGGQGAADGKDFAAWKVPHLLGKLNKFAAFLPADAPAGLTEWLKKFETQGHGWWGKHIGAGKCDLKDVAAWKVPRILHKLSKMSAHLPADAPAGLAEWLKKFENEEFEKHGHGHGWWRGKGMHGGDGKDFAAWRVPHLLGKLHKFAAFLPADAPAGLTEWLKKFETQGPGCLGRFKSMGMHPGAGRDLKDVAAWKVPRILHKLSKMSAHLPADVPAGLAEWLKKFENEEFEKHECKRPFGKSPQGGAPGPFGPFGAFLGRAASFMAKPGAPKSEFVSDATVPDGSAVPVGTTLKKTWLIKNNGTSQWPEGTQLLFVGGQLSPVGADEAVLQGTKGLPVPLAQPNEQVPVSVEIRIPEEKGKRLTGYYRLATADGKRFGCRVWLDVLATEAGAIETKAAAPAVAATPKADVSTATLAEKYSAQLSKLQRMGFKDAEMLLQLIDAAGGNEQQVIDWLVNPVA